MSESVANAAGASLRFEPIGFGVAVLILHGAYSARVELRTALEPTYIVASGAGHALPHERPDLVATVLGDWLRRLRTDAGTETK